jgi:glycosyltransferase 2 family protein
MPNVTSAVARVVRGKSWWRWGAAALSMLIVAFAAAMLLHVFRQIDFAKVLAALRTQPVHRLLLSTGFVVAGYLMLTCYDVFALRAIGRTGVPYRIAALASFTSYTIGHNCGASLFTSGLIRYRIYSAWGLAVGDIAKIAVITGLTYWLGNACVLGFGVLVVPEAAGAVDQLPAVANRLIGAAALGAIVIYLLWLLPRRRLLGRPKWQVVLPRPAATLVQMGIGASDLVCVSLAMYALLPAQPEIGALYLIVIFVTTMLIGVVSYVPGSLGVVEAGMFIGLPQFGKEELLASLLTFRFIYFALPLLLGLILLSLREHRNILSTAFDLFSRPKRANAPSGEGPKRREDR